MSGAPEDLNVLAAEFVLGTLDDASAHEVAARAQTDPALRAAITEWEERLAPLSMLAAPATPPLSLWRRLDRATAAAAAPSAGILARLWQNVIIWRCATASGFAIAAALAAVMWLREPPAPPLAALVPSGSAAAAYVAELQPNGTLRLIALRPVPVAQGKSLELWALPSGASRPIALGLLPPAGHTVAPPKLPAGPTQLMISLEPQGGSPTGLPTGPVLFAGTLTTAE